MLMLVGKIIGAKTGSRPKRNWIDGIKVPGMFKTSGFLKCVCYCVPVCFAVGKIFSSFKEP